MFRFSSSYICLLILWIVLDSMDWFYTFGHVLSCGWDDLVWYFPPSIIYMYILKMPVLLYLYMIMKEKAFFSGKHFLSKTWTKILINCIGQLLCIYRSHILWSVYQTFFGSVLYNWSIHFNEGESIVQWQTLFSLFYTEK